ncbi:MAG: DUF3488 and transglutaminase-like domain-containing protein [Ornithinimicrobium sp.]
MNLQRGLWPEAFVAALATLSVGWPLTTLLIEQSWVTNGIVAVAAISVAGAALRSLNVLPSLVASAQLLIGILTLGWMYLGSTLWFGLPTPSSASLAGDLLAEAGAVLREFAAPAPTTMGVSFLVVSVLVLTAIAVDAIGVTNAAPAIAGIPLAAAFLVSVSNNGEAMQPWFFLATTGLWLTMIAQQSDRLLARWPSADRQEFGAAPRFGSGYRNLARALGILALTAGLALAAVLPHLPPTFFGDGLGRNPDANNLGAGSGQVSFTETMDPAADLQNQSEAPVLEYTSTARLLQPLRVTATSEFDGETWQAPERDGAPVDGSELPVGPGQSPSVAGSTEEVSVTLNQLQAPHLAIPATTMALEIDGSSFDYDDQSGAVLLNGGVDGYSATYLEIALDGALEPVGPSAADIAGENPLLLEVPEASEETVDEKAQEILGGETDPLEVGRLLQSHFRTSDYTYSLELAPNVDGVSDDPITQFLSTRQGYCVQFSTAMVMMARANGIPARMAVGFLPGELQDDGVRRVIASDAHTWPELYIDGLGWTRFEPTPGVRTGVPPEVTQPETAPAEPSQAPEVPTQQPEPEPESANTPTSDTTTWQDIGDWINTWRWLLIALAVIAVALAVVPVAGRWYRQRESRIATTPHDFVESQWLLMTRSLADLGVAEPGPRSPAAMHHHYSEHTDLDGPGSAALDRVAGTLQDARYASLDTLTIDNSQVSADVAVVVGSARDHATWATRVRAVVLPRSGRVGVAEWARKTLGRQPRDD